MCGALVGFLLLPIAVVLATIAFILSAILIVLFMPVFIVFILPILIVTKCRRGQDSETVMKISEEQRCNDDVFSKVILIILCSWRYFKAFYPCRSVKTVWKHQKMLRQCGSLSER